MADFVSKFIIKGIDEFSNPFQSMSKKIEASNAAFKTIRKEINETKGALSSVTQFNNLIKKIDASKEKFKANQIEIERLSRTLTETDRPSRKLIIDYRELIRENKAFSAEISRTEGAAEKLRSHIDKLGLSYDKLGSFAGESKTRLSGLNAKLSEQEAITKRLEEHAARKSARKEAFNKGVAGITNIALASRLSGDYGRQSLSQFNAALRPAIEFDTAITKVAAKADISRISSTFKDLKAQAIRLGSGERGFSQTEVAGAQEKLAMAGVTPAQMSDSVMTAILNMAKTGDMDLESATAVATSTMRMWGLEIEKIKDIGDVLAYTANATNTDILEMAEAFKYVGPVAKIAGVSLEETSGIIGVLANAGIRGSMAGTSLKRAFTSLSSDKVREKLRDLGINVTRDGKNLEKFSTILERIGRKTAKMGSVQKMSLLKDIVGEEALAGFITLTEKAATKQGKAEILDIENRISQVKGYSERMATVMALSAGSAAKHFSAAFENLSISITEAAMPALTSFTNKLAEFIRSLKELSPEIKINTIRLGALVAGAGLFGISIGVAGPIILGFKAIILGLAKAFSVVTIAFKVLRFAFTSFSGFAIFTAISYGGMLIYENWDKVKTLFMSIWDGVKPYWEKFSRFILDTIDTISAPIDRLFGLTDEAPRKIKKLSGDWMDFSLRQGPNLPAASTSFVGTIKERAGRSFFDFAEGGAPAPNQRPAGGSVVINSPITIHSRGDDGEKIASKIEERMATLAKRYAF